MQATEIISAAGSLQEIGIIGFLALGNIGWFFVTKMLWKDRLELERKYEDCLKSK